MRFIRFIPYFISMVKLSHFSINYELVEDKTLRRLLQLYLLGFTYICYRDGIPYQFTFDKAKNFITFNDPLVHKSFLGGLIGITQTKKLIAIKAVKLTTILFEDCLNSLYPTTEEKQKEDYEPYLQGFNFYHFLIHNNLDLLSSKEKNYELSL